MSRKRSATRMPASHDEDRDMECYVVEDTYSRDQDIEMSYPEEDDRDYCYRGEYVDEDMEENLDAYNTSEAMEEFTKMHGAKYQDFYHDGTVQEVNYRYEYSYETDYHSTVWYKNLYHKFPTYRAMIDHQISQIIVPSSTDGSATTTTTTQPAADEPRSTWKYRTITDRDPDLRAKFELMARRIHPFVQVGTGAVLPGFPTTVLAFHMMTEAELDAVAEFYHQADFGPSWLQYPCPLLWRRDADVYEKRRQIGNFIGVIPRETVVPNEVVRWLAELEEELIQKTEKHRREEEEREALRRKCYWY